MRVRFAALGLALGLVLLALAQPALPAPLAPAAGPDPSVPAEVRALVSGLVSELLGPDGPVHYTWGPVMRIHYVNGDRLRQAGPGGLLSVLEPAEAWLVVGYRNGEPEDNLVIAREQGRMRVVEEGPDAPLFDATLKNYYRAAPAVSLGPDPLLIKFEYFYFLVGSGPHGIYAMPVYDNPDFVGGMDNATLWPADRVLRFMQARQREAGRRSGPVVPAGGLHQ